MIKKIKNLLFKNYSTDTALRYLPVVDLIKENNLQNSKILEVGSGDIGITPYFKKSITGLDIEFDEGSNIFLKKDKYNGEVFPYEKDCFDLIISVDSLEHVPRRRRRGFINEMIRTSRRYIILIVPCGKEAYGHDIKLFNYFCKIHKKGDRFLEEHVKNGPPEVEEIIKMVEEASEELNKKVNIISREKILNLKIRSFIMKCKISKNIFLSILYYFFLLVLPLRKFFNFGSCYRQIFFIEIFS